ncbi:hypothetical protein LL965_21650 [Xanthomonas cassavae CFBP 4642]|uniref:Rhomboid family intramembrane serine protease n=1 Tax=Xanthomonas cassavae CFBP 4642 TaxID=1219375 RepID=A0ABS8HLN4_9XANT|nr:hypothetical protein [Xanthomonas cassavae]MCC4622527.1 hypothetical protein [Xanthomonas cassavae CFBP 4642]
MLHAYGSGCASVQAPELRALNPNALVPVIGDGELALLWFNLWGHAANGAAPQLRDWSHFAAGAVGLAGAWAVQLIYRKARPPHRPSME